MENLEELWGRIGSVTMNEVIVAVLEDEISLYESRIEPSGTVIVAVLKDEISLYESRIEPSGTGYLYDSISQLKRRLEELK